MAKRRPWFEELEEIVSPSTFLSSGDTGVFEGAIESYIAAGFPSDSGGDLDEFARHHQQQQVGRHRSEQPESAANHALADLIDYRSNFTSSNVDDASQLLNATSQAHIVPSQAEGYGDAAGHAIADLLDVKELSVRDVDRASQQLRLATDDAVAHVVVFRSYR